MSSDTARLNAENHSRFAELVANDPMVRADTDMKYLLDVQAGLGGMNLQHLTPQQARKQPTLRDAMAKILQGQRRDQPDDREVESEDIVIPGPEGEIPARIYRARDRQSGGSSPMILYLHGGGWVIGNLDTYDASPRALAKKTGTIVISVQYRLAPEHKFPAAHDDTYAAWRWLVDNARSLGGNPRNAAIVGEDAGGNMALNIALRVRSEGRTAPVHLVLIHPIAGNDMSRPSYVQNMRAQPLSTFLMQWFMRQAFANADETADPRINLADRGDLSVLPETTVILAEIDPLLSEGEALAAALKDAGTKVEVTTYEGVTHEFFGLAQFVNKAMFAHSQVAENLSLAFSRRLPKT
jgi:acetyl esterase